MWSRVCVVRSPKSVRIVQERLSQWLSVGQQFLARSAPAGTDDGAETARQMPPSSLPPHILPHQSLEQERDDDLHDGEDDDHDDLHKCCQ